MSKSFDYTIDMKNLSSSDKLLDKCKEIVNSVISKIGKIKTQEDLPDWCKREDSEAKIIADILFDIKGPYKSSSGVDFETLDGKVYELSMWHELNSKMFKFKLRKRTKKELKRFQEIEEECNNMSCEELNNFLSSI